MSATQYLRVSRNAILGAAAVTAAFAATASIAEAKHKHHFGIVLNLGAPNYVYAEPEYRSCWWLKRRAINTGSSYWWKRYQYCVYG
jgi:hypothetical protein